jgi:hypothetical protein
VPTADSVQEAVAQIAGIEAEVRLLSERSPR